MVRYEWDADKARSNFEKHGVSFPEAATALGDALAWTFPDPEHSRGEERFLTIGLSEQDNLVVVSHTDRGRPSVSSVRARSLVAKGNTMRSEDKDLGGEDIRAEYDFASMSGGVRGKYADRYKAGTNLVHLEPDVAAVFRDESSVNRALRTLIDVARSQVPEAK